MPAQCTRCLGNFSHQAIATNNGDELHVLPQQLLTSKFPRAANACTVEKLLPLPPQHLSYGPTHTHVVINSRTVRHFGIPALVGSTSSVAH
eukprot:1494074-Lingulodinium_polyedra.AAC.1